MKIKLGYELKTGRVIEIPLRHLAVTGQTRKRAMQELDSDQTIVPHDPEATQAAKDAEQIGRGIVLTDEPTKPN